jgi:hypothetical protein
MLSVTNCLLPNTSEWDGVSISDRELSISLAYCQDNIPIFLVFNAHIWEYGFDDFFD